VKKWFTDWSVDKLIIVSATLCVLAEIAINFVNSYGHIYILGHWYGEDGTDARLTPVGIDLFLFVMAEVNLFLARKKRYVEKVKRDGSTKLRPEFRWPRWLLGGGVVGTVAANGAYGFHWGWTGAIIAMGSAVLLFFTVEGGMLLLRVAAEEAEKVKAKEVKQEGIVLPFQGELTQEMLDELTAAIAARTAGTGVPWEPAPAPGEAAPAAEQPGKPQAPAIADTQAWRGLSGIGITNGQGR
jgi:hypothetical protein